MKTSAFVPLLLLCLLADSVSPFFFDLPGPYCETRRGSSCCPGRDDRCTVPILGTLCYCDMFCNRTSGADCCPDFRSFCLGERYEQAVRPEAVQACIHKQKPYIPGETVKDNCNTCTCKIFDENTVRMVCDEKPCLIRSEIINGVNQRNLGWHASNYSFLWGKTLQDGIRYRLGTFKPEHLVMEMHGVHSNGDSNLEESFDARKKWPQYIRPIRDQGDCGSSWAVSTVDVAADRLAIMTNGEDHMQLSAQQLLSCQNKRQKGCSGGFTDRAWRYLADNGVLSEECYPYTSGKDNVVPKCQIPHKISDPKHVHCPMGGEGMIYKTPPPYRITPSEVDIMKEIKNNGPVQAVFLVKEDFYMYSGGVYRYSNVIPHAPAEQRETGYHSTRIIGWGVDKSSGIPLKYWLCANSWGTRWGEDGYFRILRGEDECNIEMFVVGVWAKKMHEDEHHNIPNAPKHF